MRLSRLVVPPCAQGVVWCAWHIEGWAPQPMHPLSRSWSALSWALLTVRRVLPHRSGRPGALNSIGVIRALRMSCSSVDGGMGAPSAVSAVFFL